jgi:hypothetical protein
MLFGSLEKNVEVEVEVEDIEPNIFRKMLV